MPDYILLENGDNILLEGGTDALITEGTTNITVAIAGSGVVSATFPTTFPRLIVELAVGADPNDESFTLNDASKGVLGTNTLGDGSVDYWTDISDRTQSVTIGRGRQRLLEQYKTGTCTVVIDNDDGDFSPHNLSGPYVAGGVTQLQPERKLRVRAAWEGTIYPLYLGYVDSYQPEWGHPQTATLVITASDAFKILARYDPLEESSPQGSNELSGARIDRILDSIGWPDTDRDIDGGNSRMLATTLAKNALAELQLTADSEFGAVYVSEDGKVTYRERHAIYEDDNSNSVSATFGDAVGEVPYTALRIPPFTDDLVRNLISASRVGGVAEFASDSASQTSYWKRTHKRDDLTLNNDNEPQQWADLMLSLLKDAEQRIDNMTLQGLVSDSGRGVWPQILQRTLRDRIEVRRRPEHGDALADEYFVEGIEHRIAPGREWETTFQLVPAKTGTVAPY